MTSKWIWHKRKYKETCNSKKNKHADDYNDFFLKKFFKLKNFLFRQNHKHDVTDTTKTTKRKQQKNTKTKIYYINDVQPKSKLTKTCGFYFADLIFKNLFLRV